MNKPGKRLPPALAWIPWWLSVIMAIVSYISLKYLIPDLIASYATHKPLADFLPQTAPLAAMGFLLFAGVLLYDGDEVSRTDEDPEADEVQESDNNRESSDPDDRR